MKSVFIILLLWECLFRHSRPSPDRERDRRLRHLLRLHLATSADSWGNDWLGSSEIISSGATKTFTVTNGNYDVKLIDEDGDEYIVWNVPSPAL